MSLSVCAYVYRPANPDVAIHEFGPPYLGSVKEPDAFWYINEEVLPSLVVELGWSGTSPKRRIDMDVWMVGAAPQTRLGILVNFERTNDRVLPK